MLTRTFVAGILERTPPTGLPLFFNFNGRSPRDAIATLMSLERHEVLTIDDRDRILVLAILQSGDFGGSQNRHIKVTLARPRRDNREWFTSEIMRIAPFLGEVSQQQKEHPFKGLQTRRDKKREQACAEILSTWLPKDLTDEVERWGLSLTSEMVEVDGFHMIEIKMTSEDEDIEIFRFDGWSGAMFANNVWHHRNVNPERFAHRLRKYLDDYLEDMTG